MAEVKTQEKDASDVPLLKARQPRMSICRSLCVPSHELRRRSLNCWSHDGSALPIS